MGTMLTTVADFLVQQSWQVSIVFMLALVACWGLRKASAHWRYLLWTIVIAKCLVPPVLSLPMAILPEDTKRVRSERLAGYLVATTPSPKINSLANRWNWSRSPTLSKGGSASASPVGSVSSSTSAGQLSLRQLLVMVWILVVSTCLTFLCVKVWSTHRRLKRTRLPAEAAARNTAVELAGKLGIRRVPTVYMAAQIAQPFVWGWLRGDIYLPLGFVKTVSVEHRKAMLTHELAHVARWDAAVNFIQIIVQTIFFFHPLVWWTNRRVRLEREKCCDEIVLSGFGTRPRVYCEAIIDMLASECKADYSTPALAVTGSTRHIEQRIATILTPGRKFCRRLSLVAVTTLLFVAAGVLSTALILTTLAEMPTPLDESALRVIPTENLEAAGKWQPGQVMDIRMITAETRDPLPDVSLKLGSMGPGIDYRAFKVQTTDAQGRSPFKLPDLPPTTVWASPSKPGFVPLQLTWAAEPSPAMPKSIMIPMEPGNAFGGTIRNEADQPISNVLVRVYYRGTITGENPSWGKQVDATTITDKSGRWHVDVMPATIVERNLRIFLTHPDYVSDHMKQGDTRVPVVRQPPIKRLLGQTAVMVMHEGEILRGRVIDEDGQPISDASIHDGANYWFNFDEPRAKTDEDGNFQISSFDTQGRWGANGRALTLTVEAAGYAPELVDLRRLSSPLTIRLNPGQSTVGRVVDTSGNPIEGVSIHASVWREHSFALHLEAESDADGTFRLSDVPADEVEYVLGKDGNVNRFTMSPSADEYSITVKAPFRVKGTVVDAETGKQLEKFYLIQGMDSDDGSAPRWMRGITKTIRSGQYKTTFTDTTFTDETSLTRVRVEADGYMPGVSRIFRPKDSESRDVTYNFKLRKAAPLVGNVFGLDGGPLADAKVYLNTAELQVIDGEVIHEQFFVSTETDGTGRFELPAEVERFYVVVVHEQGIAAVTDAELERSSRITILPWTNKNRHIRIARRPAPGRASRRP